ncbi:hypothetical protein [Actinoplanes subtropicus]|uniref:hypothetical protein n=1 Tax=Actinoplanes subtropicus TaxID=543632 RepID=UPI0012FCFF25|nr:hypothetical protein [Actinoplanes subtropicus]
MHTGDTIADWYAARLSGGSPPHDFARDALPAALQPDLPGGGSRVWRGDRHACDRVTAGRSLNNGAGRVSRRVVGDYLAEGFWRSANPSGVRRAGNHRRTLSAYLMVLAEHGFVIELVAEPPPGRRLAERQPRVGLPPFLAVRAELADR